MAENSSDELILIVLVVGVVLLVLLVCSLVAGVTLLALTGVTSTAADETISAPAVSAEPAAPPITMRDEAVDPQAYQWIEVYQGLDSPLYLGNAGDGSGRLFIAEQSGSILILEEGALLPEPFLNVFDLVAQTVHQGRYSEQGLLGVAFHPNYAENGLFFVHYTDIYGDNVIVRYQVSADDPNRADPASRTVLLTIDQPYVDHNGGSMAFGHDGYLYIGIGDGGNPNSPNNNSQDGTTLLGKILRIDVNAETYTIPPDNPFVDALGFLPEIWAVGARNPWRFSFDRATGDLYIGDVGQNAIEEINFHPAGAPGGINYGWSAWEGTQPYREEFPVDVALVTMPIFEYPHGLGCSVTGGYVYRGADMPDLQGVYFSGDYCTGTTWATYRDMAERWRTETFIDTDYNISSFGQDEAGNIYLVDYKGGIYRLGLVEGVVLR